jgi:hypothetical protein
MADFFLKVSLPTDPPSRWGTIEKEVKILTIQRDNRTGYPVSQYSRLDKQFWNPQDGVFVSIVYGVKKPKPFNVNIRPCIPNDIGQIFVIEIRPVTAEWAPFFVAIPHPEKDAIRPIILRGPSRVFRYHRELTNSGATASSDKDWWILFSDDEATPKSSYYLFCNQLPTKIIFGVPNEGPCFFFYPTV